MVRTLRPWRETKVPPFENLYNEMDHLVHHLFGDNKGGEKNSFVPRLDLVETEDGYEVTLDLPGVNAEDVNVELHEERLTITGKRERRNTAEGETVHRIERYSGAFTRVINLPETLDQSKISANFENGILTIDLPKSEKLKPTRIAINSPSKN